jgi:hypothetical protein
LTNYQIIKSLGDLPPARIKTFKITTDPFKIDFVRQFNSIAVAYILHNHTGGTFTYRLNDESDLIDLKSLQEGADNIHLDKFEIIGASDADLIVKLMPIALLKRFNALEVG